MSSSQPGAPVGPDGAPIAAGFWRRAAAWAVDRMVLLVALLVYLAVLGRWGAGRGALLVTLALLGLAVGAWLYFALAEASAAGATPGKQLLGLRVTGAGGERIGLRRATARVVARLLSAWTLFGYPMAAFTERKQALHDRLTRTRVVREEGGWGVGALVAVLGIFGFVVVALLGASAALWALFARPR